ncbi:MAG: DegT/DnrJ/EryC1/StrS family aminotransferase [Chloroflexi bacterium]|nr:DegT/DnrJ/EryC1/StrS family aminotransferase [Chloroflexota bacterium]
MGWRIPLSDIEIGSGEISAVRKVLESNWLSMGQVTQDFEAAFAAMTGSRHALAVTNGTAALHMACLAVGLGPGDEAIVPSLTFVATANAVRYTGATPVFADIAGENDLNLSPAAVERAITPRTRAIIAVHYGGYACDMPALLALARGYGLAVIEDAAHAVGAELDDRKLGTWGDVGCFSFFSNKNLTTGEGGMLVTNRAEMAEKLRLLRSHGMTTLTWDRHKGHAWSYDVVELGYNYRIDEIRAALGLVQLKKLPQNNDRRRRLTQVYRQAMQELAPQVSVPFQGHPGVSSAHLLPAVLPHGVSRIDFMEALKAEGIQTSIHYPPIHTFSAYRDWGTQPPDLPVTDDVAAREVTLPLYPGLSEEEVVEVCQAVQRALLAEHSRA